MNQAQSAAAPSPAAASSRHGRMRVPVVEDGQDIARLIKHTLGREDDALVDIVADGRESAANRATADPPDLIVLDLNLPVLNGFEVCRILPGRAATQRVPIIMLTARTAEADRIASLDLGADDYVTKPFSLRELAARVPAVRRRIAQAPPDDRAGGSRSQYSGKHLAPDFEAAAVAVDGHPVRLTRRELELLRCLVENRSRVMSRERLLERVWGLAFPGGTRTVDVHVAFVGTRQQRGGSCLSAPRLMWSSTCQENPGAPFLAVCQRLHSG